MNANWLYYSTKVYLHYQTISPKKWLNFYFSKILHSFGLHTFLRNHWKIFPVCWRPSHEEETNYKKEYSLVFRPAFKGQALRKRC